MEIKNIKGSQGEHYRDIGKKEWLAAMNRQSLPKYPLLRYGDDATNTVPFLTNRNSNEWYLLPECHKHNEDETNWLPTKATAVDNLVKLTTV